MNHVLADGAAIPVPVPVVRAAVHWTPEGGGRSGVPDVDASMLLLGAGGRVRTEDDFVFYNQPHHPSGLVRRLPKQREQAGFMDAVEARLDRLEHGVHRLVVAVSTDGPPLTAAGVLQLTLWDTTGGTALAVLPLTVESPTDNALVCGELVRGTTGWAFHAVRRGFPGGLPQLAAAYGVTATPPTGTTPVGTPPAGTAPQPSAYPYPQPDPDFALPPQGPQFQPGHR